MFCSKCGKRLSEEDQFCSACGSVVKQENTSNTPPENNSPAEIITPPIEKVKKPKSEYKSLLFKCILGAIGICALLEILFILTGEMWELHAKVLSSVGFIIFYGLIANVAVTYYENTEYKNLGLAIIATIAINFIMSTLLVWDILSFESEFILKLMIVLWIIFAACVHIAFLSLVDLRTETSKGIFYLTNLIISITYFMLALMVVFEIDTDFFFRLFWVFVILTLFGTVATPLINKIYKNPNDEIKNNNKQSTAKKFGLWPVIIIVIFLGPSLISMVYFAISARFTTKIIENQTISVPYAKVSINGNTLITSDMIGMMEVSKSTVESNPNLVTASVQVIGKYVRYGTTIYEGSLFYQDELVVESNDYNDLNPGYYYQNNSGKQCNGEELPLSTNMITSMATDSYFSKKTDELKILEKNFEFGLIMKEAHGSDVIINTSGCKKIKGTVAFDNAGVDMQIIEFVILKDGYNGAKLEYFNLNNGQVVDFETDISGVNQIMIRRLYNVAYGGTKVVVGNVYFE